MKFSIVTPAYNRGFVLERAIKSVLAQTYDNWEFVIVNDGSEDNTDQVVEKYLEHPNIKYVSYSINKGVNYARNRGLEKCDGDMITFLDSDDEFFPYTLEKAAEYIKKYTDKYDVFCFFTMTEKGMVKSYLKKELYSPDYYDLLGDKAPGDYLFFLKRHVFDKIRFDESINAFEAVTWLRIAKMHKFLFINKVLLIYWQDTVSILRDKKLTLEKINDFIKGNTEYLKLFDIKGRRKSLSVRLEQSKTLSRLGYYNALAGNKKESIGKTIRAICVYPLQVRAWRNLLINLLSFFKK